jgi:NAD(P)-dependent dehydrogenase (short-subunit alcohol dehydrogenase family)
VSFEGQCVIVTGAAGNLGAAVAREIGGRGANLVLVDRAAEHLEALAKTLPGKPLIVAGLDARSAEACAALVKQVSDQFGRIDALANTVGGFRMAKVAENAAADWAMLMELNALTALNLSAAVAPAMAKRKYGRIVHVAAGAGAKAGAALGVYSASKAALMRITEALAEEHRLDGVTANCVLPATIDLPQTRAADPGADTSTWVTPANLAKLIAFLVSSEAGAVTGAMIPATGQG